MVPVAILYNFAVFKVDNSLGVLGDIGFMGNHDDSMAFFV